MATAGWTADAITDDFPGLGIAQLECAVDLEAEDRVTARVQDLENRITGSFVFSAQTEPVPRAYRQLARQLGLDPDEDGTPLAALLRGRIREGRLPRRGPALDAAMCALLETGVPVFALPFSEVGGGLGLMTAMEGERLPGDELPLPNGAVVVSDLSRPLALAMLPPPLVPEERQSVVLYALRAPGVADLVIEEALWSAAVLLGSDSA